MKEFTVKRRWIKEYLRYKGLIDQVETFTLPDQDMVIPVADNLKDRCWVCYRCSNKLGEILDERRYHCDECKKEMDAFDSKSKVIKQGYVEISLRDLNKLMEGKTMYEGSILRIPLKYDQS